MGIQVGDNFDHKSKKPLDGRTQYATLALMKAVTDANIYEGCEAYCVETDKYYKFLSSNTVDETTGKWRERESGGGGSYSAGDGIDITSDVISTEKSQSGDIDEIVDTIPTAGKLVSIVNAFNKGDIYSTDEKMIGQWVNGKPLYQKTVLTGALQNASEKTVAHGIANIDIITYAYATINADNGEMTIVPYAVDQAERIINQIVLTVDKTNVYYTSRYSNDKQKYTSSYCTLRYTKTTDTAISIGEENEYSTDEKVVGTWIDSKPLYQKTINIGNIPSATGTTIAHNISDIDTVTSVTGVGVKSVSGVTTTIAIPYYRDSSNFIGVQADNTYVQFYTQGYSSYTGIITLQYTKTT